MLVKLGEDFFEAKSGNRAPVNFDTSKLINPHVLILGSSGVGKSHTIRRMVAEGMATSRATRFHVFDVHGDLDIPGASVAEFSEQSSFGLNPLRVNPSPKYGGVRKCVQAFMRTIDQASTTGLGVKQESVLRNLLFDVFRDFGFEEDNPATWSLNEYESCLVSSGHDNRLYLQVPIEEKDAAKSLGARWDGDKRLWWIHAHKYQGDLKKWPPAFKARQYPSLQDVLLYAKRLHEERFLGSDQKAVRALGAVNKAARQHQRRVLDSVRLKNQGIFDEDTEAALEAAKEKALDAYKDYIQAIRTGYELETLIKYDSPEVLKSVMDRLQNLQSTGIFRQTPPPFDSQASVWRYKLDALGLEEKKMLVLFLLRDIFMDAIESGTQNDVTQVAVVDELGFYVSGQDDKGEGIIGTIAREARKFGLGLWAATQSPATVPESVLSSVGTKIILGLDEMYWIPAINRLKVEDKLLKWVQPRFSLAAQFKEHGTLKNRWRWVKL